MQIDNNLYVSGRTLTAYGQNYTPRKTSHVLDVILDIQKERTGVKVHYEDGKIEPAFILLNPKPNTPDYGLCSLIVDQVFKIDRATVLKGKE